GARRARARPRRHADPAVGSDGACVMERPYILHLFTPGAQASPFDVNMAADAGWQMLVPYCHVALDAVAGLTQDAIFSRGPKGTSRTGIFIGGRDVLLAADMLERARKSMFPPFV